MNITVDPQARQQSQLTPAPITRINDTKEKEKRTAIFTNHCGGHPVDHVGLEGAQVTEFAQQCCRRKGNSAQKRAKMGAAFYIVETL